MEVLLEQLNGLKNHTDEFELNRVKNQMKVQILSNMESGENRLEEMARNYKIFNGLNFHEYCIKIDQVTAENITDAAVKLF